MTRISTTTACAWTVYPEVSIGACVDRDRDGAPDTCDSTCESLGMLADEDDDGDGVLDVDSQFPTISLNRLEVVQLGSDCVLHD